MTNYKRKYEEALERARQFSEKPYLEDSAGIVEYIFPELKESEDERIRKKIIDLIKEVGEDDSYHVDGFYEMIAWLEKQGEQMPAEWSKADEDMIYNIRNMIFKYAFSQSAVDVNGDLCESEYIEADQWLRSLEDRCILQPKREWSEEDEKKLRGICNYISCSDSPEGFEEWIDWLKSLKDRVYHQHNQDWHKEDEEKINKIIRWLTLDYFLTGEEAQKFREDSISFLQSRKPQSHWKPSAFHLECIEDAISLYEKRGINAIGLKEILDELKKLKG